MKLRALALRQLRSQPRPGTPYVSRLEDRVATSLRALGIPFTRQVRVRDPAGRIIAIADFFLSCDTLGLPSEARLAGVPVILEVNGTYWHADPRVYPDGPANATQRLVAAAWARKVAALKRLGVPLAVLWELDFRRDGDEAIRRALARVPVAANYA